MQSSKPKATLEAQPPKTIPTLTSGRLETRSCYRCGQRGHLARNCSMPVKSIATTYSPEWPQPCICHSVQSVGWVATWTFTGWIRVLKRRIKGIKARRLTSRGFKWVWLTSKVLRKATSYTRLRGNCQHTDDRAKKTGNVTWMFQDSNIWRKYKSQAK